MKFSSRDEIEAPISKVFEALADFDNLERAAVRRGIEVERIGNPSAPEAGLAWDLRFQFRGKPRDIRLTLDGYQPDSGMVLTGSGSGIEGKFEITLEALSPRRTRMATELKLAASTLPGRLMLQSLKLARGKLAERYRQRLSEYARLTAERLNRIA